VKRDMVFPVLRDNKKARQYRRGLLAT
jgi:hypothetical protein